MNIEEFSTLSGLTVSQRYYQTTIEPEYTVSDLPDKESFCTDWIKRNKSIICKAVSADINALSLDLCLLDNYKADAERSRDELQMERVARSHAEEEITEHEKTIERLNQENESLRQIIRENRESIDSLIADYNELLSVKAESANKDAEIVRLKAKLYDLTA